MAWSPQDRRLTSLTVPAGRLAARRPGHGCTRNERSPAVQPACGEALLPWSVLLGAGLFERCLQTAVFLRVRVKDDLHAGLSELLDVLVPDALKLGGDDARVRPLAILAVTDGADDGLHLIRTQVLSQLRVVQALGAVDGLLEQLPDGVVEWREVIAERVHFGLGGALGIALEKIVHALVLRTRDVSVVVQDAVQGAAETYHDRRVLQAHHAAAEDLHRIADADFSHRADDGGRVRGIRCYECHFRSRGADAAHHCREVHGARRVALIVYRLQARPFRKLPRAVAQVLGKRSEERRVGKECGSAWWQ